MDSDNVMTAVHEYTITNEIRIFILDITFNKMNYVLRAKSCSCNVTCTCNCKRLEPGWCLCLILIPSCRSKQLGYE